jgi:hypothetical protein
MLDNVVKLQKKTTDSMRTVEPSHLDLLKRQATFICGHLPHEAADAILILQIALVLIARLDTLDTGGLSEIFQSLKGQLPAG